MWDEKPPWKVCLWRSKLPYGRTFKRSIVLQRVSLFVKLTLISLLRLSMYVYSWKGGHEAVSSLLPKDCKQSIYKELDSIQMGALSIQISMQTKVMTKRSNIKSRAAMKHRYCTHGFFSSIYLSSQVLYCKCWIWALHCKWFSSSPLQVMDLDFQVLHCKWWT